MWNFLQVNVDMGSYTLFSVQCRWKQVCVITLELGRFHSNDWLWTFTYCCVGSLTTECRRTPIALTLFLFRELSISQWILSLRAGSLNLQKKNWKIYLTIHCDLICCSFVHRRKYTLDGFWGVALSSSIASISIGRNWFKILWLTHIFLTDKLSVSHIIIAPLIIPTKSVAVSPLEYKHQQFTCSVSNNLCIWIRNNQQSLEYS